MIFESLTLRDVGVYAGEQRIDFAPPSATQPVTLIGGLNGAGKTTLMRALFHVLYGAHALPLIERRGSYERYLRDTMRTGSDEASIELQVQIQSATDRQQITVRRAWSERRGKVKETIDVYRDGQYDEALSESWPNLVEGLAPRGIARLFFFDGEKVEALADLEEAKATLRTAVGALLGLDLVDQLVGDLAVVERRKAEAVAPAAGRARLEQLDAECATASELLAEAQAAATEAEAAAAQAAEDRSRILDAYQAAGGDVFDDREKVRADAHNASEQLALAEQSARELAANDAAPLLLVAGTLEAVAERAASLQKNADRARLVEGLLARDDALLSHLRTIRDDPQLVADIEAFLESDRAARCEVDDIRGDEQHLALIADQLASRVLGVADTRVKFAEILSELDRARALYDERQSAVAQVPAEDAMRMLERHRSDADEHVAAATSRLVAAQELVERRERAVLAAKSQSERELKRVSDAEIADLTARRVLEHADRAKTTLRELRQVAAERHLGRIAELATTALRQLLHKERLIEQLEIDPATYELTLRAASGAAIEPHQLSAGERQLTALAILWALARASGRPLPVVVDTPLGRLDASHRAHVVERYLPLASEQVIVLSTDTEIAGELHDLIQPHVGASYVLSYDADQDSTRVDPGYLDYSLTA